MISSARKRVAVIGGGISGLAAAHRVHELDPEIELTLYEAQPQLGGVVQTARRDGFLWEWGPDNFITQLPWGLQLCRRIGLEPELLPTDDQHRQAFVVRRGRLRKIPQGFVIMAPSRIWPVIATPILSPWGKLRMACEFFLPGQKAEHDESLASFVIRRFGRETYDRLVQPLVGGIYTGDPHQLSVRMTMPRFVEMERSHGSLIRAIWSRRSARSPATTGTSGARYSLFVAPREGMSSLTGALAGRLPAGTVHTGAPVVQIAPRPPHGWTVTLGGSPSKTHSVDAVVVAIPGPAASRLLADVDPVCSQRLGEIHYASCSIASLAYRREQIAHRLDGFGFVVPLREKRSILSGSFASVKYAGRAPDGEVLLRAFIGGACQPELAELPEDELIATAHREFADLLGIRGEPRQVQVSRHPQTMAQYYVGHQQRVEQIEARLARYPGLFMAGNAFEGVGIPQCIHRGERTAEQVVAGLRDDSPASPVSGESICRT